MTNQIQPGTYKAQVRDALVKVIGNKGSQAFVITFELDDGRSIDWNGWMTERAYERTMDKLAEIGFDESIPPFTDKNNEPYFKASHFKEKLFELVIENGDPDTKGRIWPQIKWVNVPGKTKAAQGTIKGLPANFKESLAAARARNGIKAPTPTKQSDNELPF